MADILLSEKNTKIVRLVNRTFSSNCYIIESSQNVIIVDPGTKGSDDLIEYIENNRLFPKYCIFTHEHFDHICGYVALKKKYPDLLLVCSAGCAEGINDSKLNFSKYHTPNQLLFIDAVDVVIENCKYMNILSFKFEFSITRGHSLGSMCFKVNNNLFTGDLLIPGSKTVTSFAGGSRAIAEQSIAKLQKMCNDDTFIMPGHGNPIKYSEFR